MLLLDLPPAHEKMAARDQHEFSSQLFLVEASFFVQHPAVETWKRKEQHRNHFSRNSGNFSYLNFVRFRALTLGDICFEQNCKKMIGRWPFLAFPGWILNT